MNIEPIKIDIKDDRLFTSVVRFFDREDVLQAINKIRLKCHISVIEREKNDKKEYKQRLKSSRTMAKAMGEKLIEYDDQTFNIEVRNVGPFETEIDKFLDKFNRSVNYYEPVRQAIVTGTIKDKDFLYANRSVRNTTVYNSGFYTYGVYPSTDKRKQGIKLGKFECAIIFSPQSTMDDVLGAFQHLSRELKKDLSWKIPDTQGNIRRDRIWYLLRRTGKSWAQIHNIVTESGTKITRDGVIKAIQLYKSNLDV